LSCGSYKPTPHALAPSIRSGVSECTAMAFCGYLTRSAFHVYHISNECDLREGARKLDRYLKFGHSLGTNPPCGQNLARGSRHTVRCMMCPGRESNSHVLCRTGNFKSGVGQNGANQYVAQKQRKSSKVRKMERREYLIWSFQECSRRYCLWAQNGHTNQLTFNSGAEGRPGCGGPKQR
jgi:hypothetical protein